MNRIDIEEWAFRVVKAAECGQPLEDDRVELKSHFPEPREIARQLGGHANTSRGDPILWLLGINEKKGVVNFESRDMAAWRPSLEAEFEGGAPSMQHFNLIWKDQPFVALLFETDGAPYVVRNPKRSESGAGPFECEVPWRDGRTRSARRAELIIMLRPIARLPSVEPADGEIRLHKDGVLHFSVYFYVVSERLQRFVISRSTAVAHLGETDVPLWGFNLHPDGSDPDVIATRSHLSVNGAGRISCNGMASAPLAADYTADARFEVKLHIPSAGREAIGEAVLRRVGADDQNVHARWILRRGPVS